HLGIGARSTRTQENRADQAVPFSVPFRSDPTSSQDNGTSGDDVPIDANKDIFHCCQKIWTQSSMTVNRVAGATAAVPIALVGAAELPAAADLAYANAGKLLISGLALTESVAGAFGFNWNATQTFINAISIPPTGSPRGVLSTTFFIGKRLYQ